MTTKIAQTILSPWLTPVRVISQSNVAGTYYNGAKNDGIGATLTIAASSLTIDSVVMVVADRLLLAAQTNANENGVYVVLSIDSIVVLQRAADQQSLEQYKLGQYVSVAAGTTYAGHTFTVVEPLPARLGVNDLTWNATASSGGGGGSTFYSGFDTFFGGSASHTFNIPGLVAGWTVVVQNIASIASQPIIAAFIESGGDQLTVTWAADPSVALIAWIAGPIQPPP